VIEVSLNRFLLDWALVCLPVVVQDLPRYFEHLDFECRGKVEGKGGRESIHKIYRVLALSTLGLIT
jgi:hypothetical protein